MFVGSKGRYAIIAMIDMIPDYLENKTTPLGEIAERQEISANYLEQLFMKLKKHNIVKATRGPKGGYTFCKKPEELYLIDILKAVGENLHIAKCTCAEDCKVCCMGNKKCNCHTLWSNLERFLNNYFSSISIKDVSENKLFSLEGMKF